MLDRADVVRRQARALGELLECETERKAASHNFAAKGERQWTPISDHSGSGHEPLIVLGLPHHQIAIHFLHLRARTCSIDFRFQHAAGGGTGWPPGREIAAPDKPAAMPL